MSKNSKNAKRHITEKQASTQRLAGNKGPSKTAPKHGKKNAWWQKYLSYASYIKGGKKAANQDQ
jgi:hypothetical protein